MSRPLSAAALLTVLAIGRQLAAAPETTVLPNDRQSLTIHFENDLFTETDRYYTNGVRLSWLSKDLEAMQMPRLARDIRDHIPLFHQPGWTNNIGIALGQSIYTPEDVRESAAIPDDRPYAGWLYGSLALHHKNQNRLHELELTVGIVGPSAFGEEAQNGIHRVRGIDTAEGWDNQLGDEPGLMLAYDYRQRLAYGADRGGMGFDFIPCLRLTVGNVLTAATVGATARIGYNLPRDFQGNSIHVSGYAAPPVDRLTLDAGQRFSLYLYATAEGSGVAHNIFIDGNTFRDSLSVDRQPWVGAAELGVGCRWDRYRLTYAHIVRSKEFDGQAGAQHYGSLSFAVSF